MMKRLCSLLFLALATGCASGASPVHLNNALVADDKCTAPSQTQVLTRGFMDLALTTHYFAVFNITSDLEATNQITVGKDVLTTPSSNNINIQQFTLQYSSQQVKGFPAAGETLNTLFTLAAGSTQDNITVDLVGRQAAQVLLAQVPPGGSPVEILVTVQAVGTVNSGGPISSNTVKFPLVVGHTSCPTGTAPQSSLTAPICGNPGQDDIIACK